MRTARVSIPGMAGVVEAAVLDDGRRLFVGGRSVPAASVRFEPALRRSGLRHRDMILTVPFLVHYLSQIMTLAPGDLILTGTPEGLRDVRPGDEVATEIERVGRLVNTIASDAEFFQGVKA